MHFAVLVSDPNRWAIAGQVFGTQRLQHLPLCSGQRRTCKAMRDSSLSERERSKRINVGTASALFEHGIPVFHATLICRERRAQNARSLETEQGRAHSQGLNPSMDHPSRVNGPPAWSSP